MEGTTSEGMNIFCLDVARDLLPDDGCQMRWAGAQHDSARSGHLRELLVSGLATFSTLEPAAYPAASQGFKSTLIDGLWQISAHPDASSVGGTMRYTAARLQTFVINECANCATGN